jgi:transglutaminase-like putative cysteine protease
MFAAMSIAADRPLAESTALTELVIELTAPKGKALPELPNTINQTVEKLSPTRLTLRITPGKGKPRLATEKERADALKATGRYPIEEEAIKQLAVRAVGDAKSDREKVQKILAFTDFFIRDSMDTEPLTVMDLIKSRKGDCSAHALLFTTLARAAGIPSHEASGWMFMGNEYKTFGGHAWNEVLLDGAWLPVDPLWGQMQLDAGHIQQHAGAFDGGIVEGMVTGLKATVISFQKK